MSRLPVYVSTSFQFLQVQLAYGTGSLMSSLYKNLRIHQIFGANTNVGKTILTTALLRASAQRGKNVFYLKPVSTGPLQDADDL